MDKRDIIKKWIEESETDPEVRNTDEYKRLEQIRENLKQFKAPPYDVKNELKRLKASRSEGRHRNLDSGMVSWSIRIAASLVIFALAYFAYINFMKQDGLVKIATSKNEMRSVYLPDSSLVRINGLSNIRFETTNWEDNRTILLRGEAFFKVNKGSVFMVKSSQGVVTVLGTEFNIFDREDVYVVNCYEGLVKVKSKATEKELGQGRGVTILDESNVIDHSISEQEPAWLQKERVFRSIPLKVVFNEIERTFNVKIRSKDVNVNQLYSGRISLTDLEQILKVITKATNTTFEIKGDNVFITPA